MVFLNVFIMLSNQVHLGAGSKDSNRNFKKKLKKTSTFKGACGSVDLNLCPRLSVLMGRPGQADDHQSLKSRLACLSKLIVAPTALMC